MLDQLNCIYDKKAVGMFVWARIPKAYKDGYQLSDELLYNAGVFITPGGIFGDQGDGYIRISLCSTVNLLEEAMAKIDLVSLEGKGRLDADSAEALNAN